jgi:hypothetical protein
LPFVHTFALISAIRLRPSAAKFITVLTIAARMPDHGKCKPRRFTAFEGQGAATP